MVYVTFHIDPSIADLPGHRGAANVWGTGHGDTEHKLLRQQGPRQMLQEAKEEEDVQFLTPQAGRAGSHCVPTLEALWTQEQGEQQHRFLWLHLDHRRLHLLVSRSCHEMIRVAREMCVPYGCLVKWFPMWEKFL